MILAFEMYFYRRILLVIIMGTESDKCKDKEKFKCKRRPTTKDNEKDFGHNNRMNNSRKIKKVW